MRELRRNGGDDTARVVSQLTGRALQAKATDAGQLLGLEGTAARLYFGVFPALLRRAGELPGPAFTGLRNHRPRRTR